MSPPIVGRLDYPFSYQDFLIQHLLPNTPCIFSPRLVSSWTCLSTFLLASGSSDPAHRAVNFPHLLRLQGATAVSVHRPSTAEEQEGGEGPTSCEDRPLAEVFDLWGRGADEGRGMYVKDWHLAQKVFNDGGQPFYDTPDVFRDDWLNGWYRSKGRDDFRFIYLGAPKTSTLLHRDVYSSNSFSTNLSGRKRWTLFPPSHTHLLRRFPDEARSELIPDVRAVDTTKFLGWSEASAASVEVIQEEGETIFVPGGWYHQVLNLPSTSQTSDSSPLPHPLSPILSLNHNWLNSTTLLRTYHTLLADIDACSTAIADIHHLLSTRAEPGWEQAWFDEVQELVRRDSGWGWDEFWGCVRWGCENALRDEPAIRDLQPPLQYIAGQVRLVLDDFAAQSQHAEERFLSEPTREDIVAVRALAERML